MTDAQNTPAQAPDARTRATLDQWLAEAISENADPMGRVYDVPTEHNSRIIALAREVQRLEALVARHAAAVQAMEPRCPGCFDEIRILANEYSTYPEDTRCMCFPDKPTDCKWEGSLQEAIAAGYAVALAEREERER